MPCRTFGQAKRTIWSFALARTLASWVKLQNCCVFHLITCLQRVPWHRQGLHMPRYRVFECLACSASHVGGGGPSGGRPRCCGGSRRKTSPLSQMSRSTSGTQLTTCELQFTCQQYAVTKGEKDRYEENLFPRRTVPKLFGSRFKSYLNIYQ